MSFYATSNTNSIVCDSESDIDDVPNVTCAAWTYARSLGAFSQGVIIGKIASGVVTGWMFHISATNTIALSHDYTGGGSANMVVKAQANAIQRFRWYFVAMTKDDTGTAANQKLYIDGIEATSYSVQTDGAGTRSSDAGQFLSIGDRGGSGGSNASWDGYIAHAHFYNRRLTETEIKSIMRVPASIRNGLLRYYPLDDGPDIWRDLSGVTGVRPGLARTLGPIAGISPEVRSSHFDPPIPSTLHKLQSPTKFGHIRHGDSSRQPWVGYMPWRNDWWDTTVAAPTSPSINVFDSVVTAESVTVKVPLAVSVSDSSVVAENVTVVIPLGVSVFDSITTTENVVVTLPLSPSVFDSITIIETNELVMVLNANVSDSILVTELVSVSLPGVAPQRTLVGVGV